MVYEHRKTQSVYHTAMRHTSRYGQGQITERQLESFKDWLMRYGRGEDSANQYANNVRRCFEKKDPLRQLSNKDLSPKYLRLIRTALKAWGDYTNNDELIHDIAMVRLPPAIRRREGVPLSREEWIALKEEIHTARYLMPSMRATLGMLVCRGFRRSDVLRMTKKEVESALRTGRLEYEGKGRKRLRFTVSSYWKGYLEEFVKYPEWDRVEDIVCPKAHPSTRRASAGKAIERALKKVGERVGLEAVDMYPHLLRKTYATLYYRKCKDPSMLQAHMQWATIDVAMGYVIASSVEELDAVADSLFE